MGGAFHIRSFMAGATKMGQAPEADSARVETRSSAIPPAIFARIFAVAGAMIIRSADSVSERCPMLDASEDCHRLVYTGRCVKAWKLSGRMN